MSDLLDAWDKIASVVSAFIGIASLVLSIRQFRRVKATVHTRLPLHDESRDIAAHEEPAARPREQALIPLSATLLLATLLLIYSDAAGSHGWRLVGLVLMGAIVVLGMVAEALTDHRQVPARPESVPKTPKRSILRAATVLPLVLVGYLFVNIPADGFGLLVTRILPVPATGLFAAVILTRSAGRRAASARRTMRPLGAFLLGLIIGAIALLVQRGPAAGWSTSENVDGAYAEGTITRTTDGELEVSGDVFDNVANYLGTRLYVDARQPGGSVTHRSFHNGGGEGSAEPIDGDTGIGVARYTVPGDTESIDVLICSTKTDEDEEVIFDVQCAATPTRIWPR